MSGNILYQTDREEIIMEHLYTIDIYATYQVAVKSNGFCGICNFCLSLIEIEKVILALDKMNINLNGEVIVEDMESDAYIKLFFEGRKFIVLGQVGGSQESHYMKFKFYADQTILNAFKSELMKY